MKHAFAVIAYRDSSFLASCVSSLRRQTRADSDIVIATSTPSAHIDTVASDYGVPVIVNPKRRDIATDWNFALRATGAPLVTLAHQDDLYRPDYVQRMQDLHARHQDLLIAFSGFEEHTASGPRAPHLNLRIKRFLTERIFQSRDTVNTRREKRGLLAWGNPVCCPSVVINRSRLPDFEFTHRMASNLDWEAWSRLAEVEGAFGYVREALVSKMVHTGSETSATLLNQRRQLEDREMFERFWPRAMARTIAALYRASYLANRV